jgi:meso-butanediol dehydrogenase / (S,S)-butanediol dehydrogenase / diacetyl reductase
VSGIGKATAELLLARGHSVVAVDLDGERLAWIDGHDCAAAVVGDVSTEACNHAMVVAAVERFGSLHTLVLNAGVAHIGSGGLHTELSDRVLAVNLRGVALGLRAALHSLERAHDPSVVTVASTPACRASPSWRSTRPARAAVINLTRSAAAEVGPRGIRVNCVCPGPTVSGMADAL